MEHAVYVEAGQRGAGDDRAAIRDFGSHVIVALADGSGGSGPAAAEAAASVVAAAIRGLRAPSSAAEIAALLAGLDAELAGSGRAAETTAVVVQLLDDEIVGASVGDSQAVVVRGRALDHLTEDQNRKPLIGSGEARPVGFEGSVRAGTLVVGSDGLFNYCSAAGIASIASGPIEEVGRNLADLARLRSGSLPDDLAVVVVRNPAADRAAQRPKVTPAPIADTMRILLVENDIVFAEVVTEQFLGSHDVVHVATVASALAAAGAQAYDAVLCDYDLDDGKGVEVVRALRLRAFSGLIVAISSHDEGNSAMLLAGCDSACPKLCFDRIERHLRGPRFQR